MSTFEELRTVCECCEGVTRLTPARLFNRPGLPALAYRAGTHARFKSSMLAAISGTESLRALTTRKDEDYTIALIDAWAVVLDVLTFYQERIANEAFLRTALQRRSLLELARLIGYELGPGVAAGTLLAFLLDASPGSPREVTIALGTAAQSLPTKEQVPQTFETTGEFLAKPAWSELKPRPTHPQLFDSTTRRLYVAGLAANLSPGDPMLLVTGDDGSEQEFLRVVEVTTDAKQNWTAVTLEGEVLGPKPYVPPSKFFGAVEIEVGSPLNVMVTGVQQSAVSTAQLQAMLLLGGYQTIDFADSLASDLSTPPPSPPPTAPGLYALRVSASPFGHNAPLWDTTPTDWRNATDGVFKNDWEGRSITKDSQGSDLDSGSTIRLERSFSELAGRAVGRARGHVPGLGRGLPRVPDRIGQRRVGGGLRPQREVVPPRVDGSAGRRRRAGGRHLRLHVPQDDGTYGVRVPAAGRAADRHHRGRRRNTGARTGRARPAARPSPDPGGRASRRRSGREGRRGDRARRRRPGRLHHAGPQDAR